MRGLGLIASVTLLAGLVACAEPVGPSYPYAPLYELGLWPDGYYYCCAAQLVRVKHFHQYHHHGTGGHHR